MNIMQTIVRYAPHYLSASVVTSGITLLMTKYYTSVFTPEEYGVLALYLVMFNYIKTFVSLNMDSGATRFYFDYRENRRDEYLSTIFWFITSVAIVVLLIGLCFTDTISSWIAPDTKMVYLVTLLAGIGAVYVSFLTRILYNEQKSGSVFKHALFQNLLNHLSSFIFISYFHLGILGRMSGQGLGYFANIFTLFKEFMNQNLFRVQLVFNKAMAHETFMLSLPGIIASFQTVVFIYLDRVFLKHFIGDSAVGIYTLGYMLGQGLSMVYEAISQAMLPKVYQGLNEDYIKTKQELVYFSYKYYFGLILITIVISSLSPWIVALLSNDDYQDASLVMPFIMAGFMMGGFYKVPSLILGYHKIVWFYPVLSLFSFGINAFLNWWLIPLYGIVGAAFASFSGLFIYSFVMQFLSFKFMGNIYRKTILIGYLGVFLFVSTVFLRVM